MPGQYALGYIQRSIVCTCSSTVLPLHVVQGRSPPALYLVSSNTASPVRSVVNLTARLNVLYVLSLGSSIACPRRAEEETFQPLYVLVYRTLLPVRGAVNCYARRVRTELQRSIVCTRNVGHPCTCSPMGY
jgi:hypothetical protein